MDSILAGNAQNRFGSLRFGFWVSAPEPAGGAYNTPLDPLVAKGFLLSASEDWQKILSKDHLRGTHRHCSRTKFGVRWT